MKLLRVLWLLPMLLLAGCGSGSSPGSVNGEYVSAGGHIWTGVTIYNGTGETKNPAFVVLGGNDNHTDPVTGRSFRGLKVRYPDGTEEWKDRDAFIAGDIYWVKADDPALKAERWETFTF